MKERKTKHNVKITKANGKTAEGVINGEYFKSKLTCKYNVYKWFHFIGDRRSTTSESGSITTTITRFERQQMLDRLDRDYAHNTCKL